MISDVWRWGNERFVDRGGARLDFRMSYHGIVTIQRITVDSALRFQPRRDEFWDERRPAGNLRVVHQLNSTRLECEASAVMVFAQKPRNKEDSKTKSSTGFANHGQKLRCVFGSTWSDPSIRYRSMIAFLCICRCRECGVSVNVNQCLVHVARFLAHEHDLWIGTFAWDGRRDHGSGWNNKIDGSEVQYSDSGGLSWKEGYFRSMLQKFTLGICINGTNCTSALREDSQPCTLPYVLWETKESSWDGTT